MADLAVTDRHLEALADRLAELPLPAEVCDVILTRLSASEQQTILLELEGIGRQTTARLVGWSESTVRVLRRRAWAKVGQALVERSMLRAKLRGEG